MQPSDDARLQALHAHYLDTFAHIQATLRQRDRLFLFILILISVMLLQMVAPEESERAISEVVGAKLGLSTPLDISVLGSVIWFALLALVVRYFQAVVHLERQYDYIHDVEDQLSRSFDGKAFTREGQAYLGNYPLFSRWTWVLYTILFPGLLIAVLGLKLGTEVYRSETFGLRIAFDAVAFAAVFVSTVLYLALVHFRR